MEISYVAAKVGNVPQSFKPRREFSQTLELLVKFPFLEGRIPTVDPNTLTPPGPLPSTTPITDTTTEESTTPEETTIPTTTTVFVPGIGAITNGPVKLRKPSLK